MNKLVCVFIVLFVWAFLPFTAFADEVQVDVDDFDGSLIFQYNSENVQTETVTAYDLLDRVSLRRMNARIGSGFDDAFQVMQPYASNTTYIPLSDKVFHSVNHANAYPVFISNLDLGIDYTLPELQGYYTVSYDIYLGVSVNFPRNNIASTLTNIWTIDPSTYQWTDQEGHTFSIIYIPEDPAVDLTFTASGNTMTSQNFLHLRAFYIGVDSGETISLHLLEYFNTHLSGLSAQGVYGNGYDIAAYMFQAFFIPDVEYLPEPPATPTPVPTPYPGQDTQESINAGVQVIVNALDISATPVPAPEDITLDPDDLQELETMTLPDLSPTSSTFSDLWDIFAPAVPYLGMLIGSIFAVCVFLWILEGRWF